MHSRNSRINRLSLVPFYLVIPCYSVAVILLSIDGVGHGKKSLDVTVDTLYVSMTYFFMTLVLLTITVHWDLLGALLTFQHGMGP